MSENTPKILEEGLTFEDVLVVPAFSEILPRETNTETNTETQRENEDNNSEGEMQNMCVICRGNIDNNCVVRRINKCNHFFHAECADTWFQDNITCPHCRQDIREADV